MHGILNGLKRIQCICCHQETPGFDIPYSDLRVLERGEKIYFTDGDIAKQLKKSKVLAVRVRLDPNFNKANQCVNESKFFKGFALIVPNSFMWLQIMISSRTKTMESLLGN